MRRKGFSTYRPLPSKPSFKVKFYEDVNFTKKMDLNLGRLGGVESDIVADKATFNNMAYSTSYSGNGEVEAYGTFHEMDYPGMPAASYVQISTYRGAERVSRYVGSVIEDMNNDDHFSRMSHEYGTNYLLVEVDNTGLEYKTASGTFKKSGVDRKLLKVILNREEEEEEDDGPLRFLNHDEMLRFYIGERLTHNWDGACLRLTPNNFYIVVWTSKDGETNMRFLPKGMDWVFQGCVYDMFASTYCGPVQSLLHTNATDYESMSKRYTRLVPYRSSTCAEEVGITIMFVCVSVVLALISTLLGIFLFVRCRHRYSVQA